MFFWYQCVVNVALVLLLVPVCCECSPGDDTGTSVVNVALVLLLVPVCCECSPGVVTGTSVL